MTHRYAIFSAVYLPHEGGVENYTHFLAAELARCGNTVDIVTLWNGAEYSYSQESEGVCVHRLPGRCLLDGRLPLSRKNYAWQSATDNLAKAGIDRVLVNTRFYSHSLDGLEFAKRVGVPVLLLDHGSAYLSLGNSVLDWIIRRYENLITQKAKAYAPIFAGVSAKSIEWLNHFGIKTNIVLPNAIDASGFLTCSSHRDFRHEFGIAADECLVAFVGRIAPEKGVEQLVQAAQLLAESGFVFVLAGDGLLRSRLVSKAPSNVHLLGSVPRSDASALLQSANLFCLPSRSEGFSTALLEAAACGLPIVATDVGGARELVPSEEYGEIIPDADFSVIAEALVRADARFNGNNQARSAIARRVERDFCWSETVLRLQQSFLPEGTDAYF